MKIYIPIRMPKIKKAVHIRCQQGCGTTVTLIITSGSVKWYKDFGKHCDNFLEIWADPYCGGKPLRCIPMNTTSWYSHSCITFSPSGWAGLTDLLLQNRYGRSNDMLLSRLDYKDCGFCLRCLFFPLLDFFTLGESSCHVTRQTW